MKRGVSPPIRVATVSIQSASSAASPRASAAAAHEPRTYVVRAGDTLFSIARRHDITVNALLAANTLTPRSVIQPGRRLRLP
jgi:LysM repeat protein